MATHLLNEKTLLGAIKLTIVYFECSYPFSNALSLVSRQNLCISYLSVASSIKLQIIQCSDVSDSKISDNIYDSISCHKI